MCVCVGAFVHMWHEWVCGVYGRKENVCVCACVCVCVFKQQKTAQNMIFKEGKHAHILAPNQAFPLLTLIKNKPLNTPLNTPTDEQICTARSMLPLVGNPSGNKRRKV